MKVKETNVKMSEEQEKSSIRELRAWAKNNLLSKTVYHAGLGNEIRFTGGGIKEYLNQPHRHFAAKNEFIQNVEEEIPKASFVADAPAANGDTNKHYYYLKTMIGGEESYFVIRHTKKENMYVLYSIVDKLRK